MHCRQTHTNDCDSLDFLTVKTLIPFAHVVASMMLPLDGNLFFLVVGDMLIDPLRFKGERGLFVFVGVF